MRILSSHCPICGNKVNITSIVTYPSSDEDEPETYGHATLTDKGEIHCSFNEGAYKSREEADEAANDVNIYELAYERQMQEALHEYDDFLDYGPPDSDPYDVDGPMW